MCQHAGELARASSAARSCGPGRSTWCPTAPDLVQVGGERAAAAGRRRGVTRSGPGGGEPAPPRRVGHRAGSSLPGHALAGRRSPSAAAPTRRPGTCATGACSGRAAATGSVMRPPAPTHATGTPSSHAHAQLVARVHEQQPRRRAAAPARRAPGDGGTSTGAVRNAASSPSREERLALRARAAGPWRTTTSTAGRRQVRAPAGRAGATTDVTSNDERALRGPAQLGVQRDLVARARPRSPAARPSRSSSRRQTSAPPSPASRNAASSSVAFAARVATSTRRVRRLSRRAPSPAVGTVRRRQRAPRRAAARRAAPAARPARRRGSCPRRARRASARSGRRARAARSPPAATKPPDRTNRARVCDASMVMRASILRRAASIAAVFTSGALRAPAAPRPRAARLHLVAGELLRVARRVLRARARGTSRAERRRRSRGRRAAAPAAGAPSAPGRSSCVRRRVAAAPRSRAAPARRSPAGSARRRADRPPRPCTAASSTATKQQPRETRQLQCGSRARRARRGRALGPPGMCCVSTKTTWASG